MLPSNIQWRSRKHIVAIFFAVLALLSWAFDASDITRASLPENLTQIPFALAKDDRIAGPLEMFLRMDGVQGDAMDQKHKGEIDIDSYAWQVSRPTGSQKPSMDTFIVTMPSGKALPRLFLTTAGALRLQKIVLAVRKSGSDSDFIKWTLTDATIVSLKTVGNTHGDGVSDQMEIAFGKLEVEYTPRDGSPPQKAGWDQRTGKSVGY